MQPYQPDRVVKTLSFLASFVYFVTWVALALIVVVPPVARLVQGPRGGDWVLHTTVPVSLSRLAPAPGEAPGLSVGVSPGGVAAMPGDKVQLVPSRWPGAGPLELSDVHGEISVPVGAGPGWFMVLSWVALLGEAGLALLFLYHLRRLFQRVRGGSPFEAENARRLRWLGVLLLLLDVWTGVTQFVQAVAVTKALEGGGLHFGQSLHIDGTIVFIALVLIALAEIFRRGAALEEEQALVV